MNWKKILSDYFTFSRKDRAGILVLLGLILLIPLIPYFYGQPVKQSSLKADTALLKAIKTAPQAHAQNRTPAVNQVSQKYFPVKNTLNAPYNKNAILFQFDPNTLNISGWIKLGLPARTAQTIENYRSKGGKFYKREDLKKIWGLPEGFYDRVESFIQIPDLNTPIYTANYKKEKRESTFEIIDINKADTSAFIALPGIGSILANRIISFRDKLGGFYSIDQISETYGLPDSTFQKLKSYFQISGNQLRTININTATKEDLKAHPYIRWNLANAIIEYRNQHGNFHALEDLEKIVLIDEQTLEKITPYLTL